MASISLRRCVNPKGISGFSEFARKHGVHDPWLNRPHVEFTTIRSWCFTPDLFGSQEIVYSLGQNQLSFFLETEIKGNGFGAAWARICLLSRGVRGNGPHSDKRPG